MTGMRRRVRDILEAIRALPKEQRHQLLEQLRREFEPAASRSGAADPSAIIGLFADEPGLPAIGLRIQRHTSGARAQIQVG